MTTTERRVKRVATPELSLVHIPTILVTILLPPDGNLGVTNSLQTARREEDEVWSETLYVCYILLHTYLLMIYAA